MSVQTFFNQQATLKNRTGYDQYGKESQGTGTIIYCRFQNTVKTRIHPDGSVEDIDALVFTDPAVAVAAGDHIVYNGVDYRVLNVNSRTDGRGLTHHNELRVTKWQS